MNWFWKPQNFGFTTLGWVFGANFLFYVGLLETEVNYKSVQEMWNVNMKYEGTYPDVLRKNKDL